MAVDETSDSVVDAEGLTTKRGIGHPNLVGSRAKSGISVQERLRSEVLALGVERPGRVVIDLDRRAPPLGLSFRTPSHRDLGLHYITRALHKGYLSEVDHPKRSRRRSYGGRAFLHYSPDVFSRSLAYIRSQDFPANGCKLRLVYRDSIGDDAWMGWIFLNSAEERTGSSIKHETVGVE